MKIEDCVLTIEQAREFQLLKIGPKNTVFSYIQELTDYLGREVENPELKHYLLHLNKGKLYDGGLEKWDIIPTLTTTEMMNMLPRKLYDKDNTWVLNIIPYSNEDEYKICYKGYKYSELHLTFSGTLRSCLFETIKYLKINKLI